jgi:hypothetical protein
VVSDLDDSGDNAVSAEVVDSDDAVLEWRNTATCATTWTSNIQSSSLSIFGIFSVIELW